MSMRKNFRWRYSNEERPQKEGTYWVVIIYYEYKDGKKTGRRVASISSRWYGKGNISCPDWVMQNEPKDEDALVWTEETGSAEGEQVWAWAPFEDIPKPENMPDGVAWDYGS